MDAALVTRMLNVGYNVSSEPAKDVTSKKTNDFKDVLFESVQKEEKKDVKKEECSNAENKDVEDMDVKDKDVEDKNVEDKNVENESNESNESNEFIEETEEIIDKTENKKNCKKIKDENENMTEKVNGLIEKVLEEVENKEDVEDIGKLKELVGELGTESLPDEEMLKIQEELKNRLMEKNTEVGPQSVETEELSEYEKIKNKLDSMAEKLGISNEDVENEDVQLNSESGMTDANEEEKKYFVTSEEREKILPHKDEKKDSKFNIMDLRKNSDVGNKMEITDINIEDVNKEITEVKITDVDNLIMSRAEKLQEQIDVIKQVSEQINVTLTEDRSEMVIKLKPDNLGKVTMQISIENGNVIAKFLAESQKVKEILESNMQNLKEHLTKQGMVIQDLSVSVGNENKQQEMFTNRSRKNFGRHQNAKGIQTGSHFAEENIYGIDEGNISSYWPDSTVSFSA